MSDKVKKKIEEARKKLQDELNQKGLTKEEFEKKVKERLPKDLTKAIGAGLEEIFKKAGFKKK